MSNRIISGVSLLVPTYEAGLACYRDKLGFAVVEDTNLGQGKRWLVVAPSLRSETRLILAEASDDAQRRAIGAQTGGRVGFFLQTADFDGDHAAFLARGITFHEDPREEPYGKVAVFEDDFGNKWDLIQPK